MAERLYNTAMHIENSLDWANVESALNDSVRKILPTSARGLRNNMQAKKLVHNLRGMITELSLLEVHARRTRQIHAMRDVEDKVIQINAEIYNIEQWILLLILSN